MLPCRHDWIFTILKSINSTDVNRVLTKLESSLRFGLWKNGTDFLNPRWMHHDPRGQLPYSTTDLAETPGRASHDLFVDHEGRLRAFWWTPGLWPTSRELGVVIDLYRDGPGTPSLVCDREGRRERI